MAPQPQCITFDCYGTLVQWHAALHLAVRSVLTDHRKAFAWNDIQISELVDALRALSMARQERPPYCDYKTILKSSLEEAMNRRGLSASPHDGEQLLSYLREIPPHPEVPSTLARLRKQFGWRSSATRTTI